MGGSTSTVGFIHLIHLSIHPFIRNLNCKSQAFDYLTIPRLSHSPDLLLTLWLITFIALGGKWLKTYLLCGPTFNSSLPFNSIFFFFNNFCLSVYCMICFLCLYHSLQINITLWSEVTRFPVNFFSFIRTSLPQIDFFL